MTSAIVKNQWLLHFLRNSLEISFALIIDQNDLF
jgi:hypothetical protein